MIALKRGKKPQILEQKEKKWLKNLVLAIENYETTPSEENKKKLHSAQSKYRQEEVKKALVEMSKGKCAYCESNIVAVDYGHIEHYRPKSRYPSLTFDWLNFLLGCAICNGAEFKGDYFDEQLPFIDPSRDNPNKHFRFEYDPIAELAVVIGISPRGVESETRLGLNRKDLIQHRTDWVRKVAFIAAKAKEGDLKALELLHRSCREDQSYSAFAKALRQQFSLPIE